MIEVYLIPFKTYFVLCLNADHCNIYNIKHTLCLYFRTNLFSLEFALNERTTFKNHFPLSLMRFKRVVTIVDECCRNACNYDSLEMYCAARDINSESVSVKTFFYLN